MSKPLGIKTMPELYQEVKKRIGKEGLSRSLKLINEVEDHLLRFGYQERDIDIEAVFSVLGGSLSPTKSIREAGPFSSYVVSALLRMLQVEEQGEFGSGGPLEATYFRSDESLKKSIDIAKRVIVDECSKLDLDSTKQIYGNVMAFLNNRQIVKVKHPISEKDVEFIPSLLVTTNYDLAIERYFRSIGQDLNDGFAYDRVDGQNHLALEGIRQGGPLDLIKLHGSINWFIRSDGEIIKRIDEPSGSSFFGDDFIDKLLIYPMQEKYVSKDPYASLFTLFRRALFYEVIHIAVGYSFRDAAINNAFQDAARMKPGFFLFVVGPEAEKVLKDIGLPEDKCRAIPYRIEDPRAYAELTDCLKAGH